MKNCPDDIEKQSRRAFTKSITAALMALPFTPSSLIAEKISTTKQASASLNPRLSSMPLNLMVNHIPPITLRGESFEVESRVELKRNDVSGARPFRYIPDLEDDDLEDPNDPNPDIYGRIERVRVIDEFGQREYYNQPSAGQWKIEVFLQKVLNEKNKPEYQRIEDIPEKQIVLVQGGPFEMFIGEKFNTEGEKQYRRLKRHKKYKRDKFDGKRVRIGKVRITKPNTLPFDVPGDPDNGFQVFITFDDEIRGLIHPTDQRCRRLKGC